MGVEMKIYFFIILILSLISHTFAALSTAIEIKCHNTTYQLTVQGQIEFDNKSIKMLFVKSYSIERNGFFSNTTYKMLFTPSMLECRKIDGKSQNFRCNFENFDHFGNSDSIAPNVEFYFESENVLKVSSWFREDGRWEDGDLMCQIEF